MPLSGFLKGKDRDMVSLHDLIEALLPLPDLMACSNADPIMCMGSYEFLCVAGLTLVGGKEKSLGGLPPSCR